MVATNQSTTPVKTVYLIDDDAAALDSMALLLQTCGFASVPYQSAEQFLSSDYRSEAACVVSDVRMLELSGFDVLRRLAECCPELPVILISAFADVEMAVRAMGLGAISFLKKPCTEQELWDALYKAFKINDQLNQKRRLRNLARCDLALLDDREASVLNLVMSGLANKQIADNLGWSLRTIEKCRSEGLTKLGLRSPFELARKLVDAGFEDWSDLNEVVRQSKIGDLPRE